MRFLSSALIVLVLSLALVACRKDPPVAPRPDAVEARPAAAADPRPAQVDLQLGGGPARMDLKPTDPNAKYRIDDLTIGGAPAK